MSDQIGRVFDGRYRLVAPIGTGASGQVFLAEDVRLRRRVAVKVLHPSLADDESFLRRFQAEAHAAAALNHPHVMAVYDWGRDEVPYLVTEYLGGGSLRALLDKGHRLTLSQALLVGLEASRGLDYAHRRGFVHRDVKPANLLFGDDGRLRIADFGLARALAEAGWTEPSGAVLGTARYASPEQARGESVDGKSDVYALGLTLVESVSGNLPFVADTTIATLMARIDKQLELDDSFGVLRPVLERACAPDPAARPDARSLATALMAAADGMPRPSPLPLAGAIDDDAVPMETSDPTILGGAAAAAAAAGAMGAATAAGKDETVDDLAPSVAQPDADVPTSARSTSADPDPTVADLPVVEADAPSAGDAGDAVELTGRAARRAEKAARKDEKRASKEAAAIARANGQEPKKRRWPWVLLALLLAVAIGGGVAFAVDRLTAPPNYEVEDFTGVAVDEVAPLVEEYGWTVEVVETRVTGAAHGTVLSQEPEPGTEMEEGAESVLRVTVSTGNELAPVPTGLEGMPRADAEAAITGAGFAVGAVADGPSEDVEAGLVTAVDYGPDLTGDGELPEGHAISLAVSSGPAPRVVPGVGGRSYDEVAAELESIQLAPERAEESSETVPEGEIIRLDPAEGSEVARGSTVRIVVSTGLPMVTVPDVRGMDEDDAIDELEAVGLVIGDRIGRPNRQVLATDPPGGESVRKGTEVTIITRST
jgi:eukaryotic-like serine/threonine-protein kinase